MEKTIRNYLAMLKKENMDVPEYLNLDTLLAFKRPKNMVFPTLEAIKKQKLQNDTQEGTKDEKNKSAGQKRRASETTANNKEEDQGKDSLRGTTAHTKQNKKAKRAKEEKEEEEEEGKRVDPFAKAKKIAEEKQKEKERLQREKEEKERKRKESEQERKKKKSQAFQKTKKGQPVLKNVIGSLLNKIETEKKNNKK